MKFKNISLTLLATVAFGVGIPPNASAYPLLQPA
jgi:hypothetical protein